MTDPVMLLSQAHGEGRVTFRALRAAGFYTIGSVAEAQIQVLADRAHLSVRTARRLKAGAEEMVGEGIGRDFPAPEIPVRGGRGRSGRGARRGDTAARVVFSEGLTEDEAVLLGQGPEAKPAPSVTSQATASRHVAPSSTADDPGHPLAAPERPDPALLPILMGMAAAAEAAAAIPRVGGPAAATRSAASASSQAPPAAASASEDAAPRRSRDDDGTFWSFG